MTMIIIIGTGSITKSITKNIGIMIMIGKCGEAATGWTRKFTAGTRNAQRGRAATKKTEDRQNHGRTESCRTNTSLHLCIMHGTPAGGTANCNGSFLKLGGWVHGDIADPQLLATTVQTVVHGVLKPGGV